MTRRATAEHIAAVSVTVDGRRWRRLGDVASLRHADKGTRVYALDAQSGRVVFGDGRHGALPPVGSVVRIRYRFGVGNRGNSSLVWSTGSWPPRKPAWFARLATTLNRC